MIKKDKKSPHIFCRISYFHFTLKQMCLCWLKVIQQYTTHPTQGTHYAVGAIIFTDESPDQTHG
jgi:hypothetical protein